MDPGNIEMLEDAERALIEQWHPIEEVIRPVAVAGMSNR